MLTAFFTSPPVGWGLVGLAGATLATRNLKDFAGLGIALHDPWA